MSTVAENLGADLTTITPALDVACLGLWMSGQMNFPFLERWDNEAQDRTPQLWVVVILAHILGWFISRLLGPDDMQDEVEGNQAHRERKRVVTPSAPVVK